MSVRVDPEWVGNVLVLHVRGQTIATENVAAFRSASSPAIERAQTIVFDLAPVTFMDSTGLGALLSFLRSIKMNGGQMRICSVGTEVRRLFDLVMMDRVFDIFPDVDSAVRGE